MPDEHFDQLNLLGGEAVPLAVLSPPSRDARSSDPETSQHAARLVKKTDRRLSVLRAFGERSGLTDHELSKKLGCKEGSAAKHRFRAQEAGLVQEWMGTTGCLTRATDTGAPARVHRLTMAGVDLLRQWESETE